MKATLLIINPKDIYLPPDNYMKEIGASYKIAIHDKETNCWWFFMCEYNPVTLPDFVIVTNDVWALVIRGASLDEKDQIAKWMEENNFLCKFAPESPHSVPKEYLLIPAAPSPAHIDSIAMRLDHSFGLLTENQKESRRATARQMYNECSGQGFYTIKTDPVAGGWTGNASADLALTLLGRLDSSLEDDGRIEQIEQIIRGLARGKGY